MRDIHDIQAPFSLYFNFVPAIIFFTILFLIILFLIYLSFRKNRSSEQTSEKRTLTAADLAIQELEKIRKDKLIEQKKYEMFYNRLTLAIRKYLLQRYSINTDSRTSTEIINQVRSLPVSQNFIKNLELCLRDYDFAKYSSYDISSDDMNHSFDVSYKFFKEDN